MGWDLVIICMRHLKVEERGKENIVDQVELMVLSMLLAALVDHGFC